jgi:hypothetical protein
MIWREYAKQLKEVLALEGSPIGVAFSDAPASNGKASKIIPCNAFYMAARKGVTFNISAETCTCPGGMTSLGLAAPSPERAKLVKKFLIEGEKFSSCNASFFRSRAISKAQPPLGISKYGIIGSRVRRISISLPIFNLLRLNDIQLERLLRPGLRIKSITAPVPGGGSKGFCSE